tara:strand:+ start:141 stop:308 length:168 start_codon:yes stop_codon:yes gene_type:complete
LLLVDPSKKFATHSSGYYSNINNENTICNVKNNSYSGIVKKEKTATGGSIAYSML